VVRDRSFLAICAAMGASTVALSMLGTLVPLFAVDRALGATAVGVLVALPNVFPVVLAVAAGRWVDRGGPARWLLVGTLGVALGPIALTAVPGVAALAASQLVIGVAQLFATLAAQSLVADVRNGRSTAQNFGWFTTTLSAGRLVGPLLAGLVVDLAGFRAAFAVAAIATAVPVAIAAWLLREGRRAREASAVAGGAAGASERAGAAVDVDDAERARRQAAGPTLANVGVQLAVLASAGVFVAVSVRQAFLPVLLTDLGYSATAIGALVSVGSLAAVLVRPAMPWFARVLGGPARALVVAMAAVAVGVGALGLVGSWGAFTALAVVAGFGTGVGLPLSIVTVASHVDPRRRGAALGLRLSLNRAAQLTMPVAMGALLATSGFAVAFGLTGAALAVLAVLAALRVPTFERTPPVA
jgi:MFS family permease